MRRGSSLGRRQLLTPDEVLRLQPDEELIFVRGQKVLRAQRFDYSRHPDYKKLKSAKAILHEPDWKNASRVSSSEQPQSVISADPAPKNRRPKPEGSSPPSEPKDADAAIGRSVNLNEILKERKG